LLQVCSCLFASLAVLTFLFFSHHMLFRPPLSRPMTCRLRRDDTAPPSLQTRVGEVPPLGACCPPRSKCESGVCPLRVTTRQHNSALPLPQTRGGSAATSLRRSPSLAPSTRWSSSHSDVATTPPRSKRESERALHSDAATWQHLPASQPSPQMRDGDSRCRASDAWVLVDYHLYYIDKIYMFFW
jgi:hypothetical protein